MTRMLNIALAFTTALSLSSCGSNINKDSLIGFWLSTQTIDKDGKSTDVADDKADAVQFTADKIVFVAPSGRSEEAKYRLDGNKLIVTVTDEVAKTEVEKEYFSVESVDSSKLTLVAGKDADENSKGKKNILSKITEEQFTKRRK